MKNYIFILILFILSAPAFAQTTTNNTTTTSGTTNATVTSPGNVVVSTPNGTIGNQVNTPANTNNVYVVTPGSNSNNNNGNNDHQHLSPSDLARLQQQRDRSDYDRAQSQHDYRDRANYYNIRRNEAVQSDQKNSANSVTQQNYQADYHSSYPAYYNNNHSRH